MAAHDLQTRNSCNVKDLGLIDYGEACSFQEKCVEEVRSGAEAYLLLCEHPLVLTMGRLAKPENILYSRRELEGQGVKVFSIARGGDVTLHSPGQLVVYPILNLEKYGKDLRRYIYRLEQVAIDFLGGFDILASRNTGKTGAWIDADKIVSIGIGVKRWVSFHGMAININNDLKHFSLIKPCDLDVKMTSVSAINGKEIDMNIAKEKLVEIFCNHFNLDRK